MSKYIEKEGREKCWKARDDYWSCLNKNAPDYTITSGKEITACIKLRKIFENSCPSQWTKHFDRKRNYELFKEKMAKGYDPLKD